MIGPERSLALSRTTLAWVRNGGKPTRSDWRWQLQSRWQSYWFERNLSLSQLIPQSNSKVVDPVFILGLWRSGTTFLHELLASSRALIFPTTWQCMHPSLHRLRKPPAETASVERPMDRFSVDTLSPQEDEFALLSLGVPSVYRGFLDPRRLPQLAMWLDPDAWSCTEPIGWFETWYTFLSGLTGDQTGRLVLKSPTHTFRLRALIEAFPSASYVWLVRDPEEVWHSNLKMWHSMFRTYALWDWSEDVLMDFLQTALDSASKCLSIALESFTTEQFAVVEFNGLVRQPVECVRALNDRFQLSPTAEMVEAVAAKARKYTNYPGDTYELHMPASMQSTAKALQGIQSRAVASHGLFR